MTKSMRRFGVVTATVVVLTTLANPAAQASPNIPVIGPGPSGNRWGVSCIQDALGVDVDGRFGEQTYQAVKDFQSLFGLQVDGAVGIQTGDALFAVNGGHLPVGCRAYVPSSDQLIDPGIYNPDMARRYGVTV